MRQPSAKYHFFSLLLVCFLAAAPLLGQEGEEGALSIPEIILTGQDTSLLLPPFDPLFDSALTLSPRLGLIALEFRVTAAMLEARDTDFQLFPPEPVVHPPEFSVGLGLDSRLQMLAAFRGKPGTIAFSSFLELAAVLPLLPGEEGGWLPELSLGWQLTPRLIHGDGELALALGLFQPESGETTLIHSGRHQYTGLPSSAQVSHQVDWFLHFNSVADETGGVLAGKEKFCLFFPGSGWLSRLQLDLLLATETLIPGIEPELRLSLARDFTLGPAWLGVWAGAAVLTDFSQVEFGPEAEVTIWLPASFTLRGRYTSFLEGPWVLDSLWLQLPSGIQNQVAEKGWSGGLEVGAHPFKWLDAAATLAYYSGTFQLAEAERIVVREDLGLDLDTSLNIRFPGGFWLHLGILQGLAGTASGQLFLLKTGWADSDRPRTLLLQFCRNLQPEVLHRQQLPGSALKLEGLWAFTPRWSGEVAGEINFDQSLNYLDFHLRFSIFYNLIKE